MRFDDVNPLQMHCATSDVTVKYISNVLLSTFTIYSTLQCTLGTFHNVLCIVNVLRSTCNVPNISQCRLNVLLLIRLIDKCPATK